MLEHLRDPAHELNEVLRILRPLGTLYLTTPNFRSLSRRILGDRWRIVEYPEHLMYFSPRPLSRLLDDVGLRPRRIWTSGLSVGDLLGGLRPTHRHPEAQASSTRRSIDANLREQISTRTSLQVAQRGVDAMLRAVRMGDTLKALADRPPPSPGS